MSFNKKVWQLCKKVPRGKVTTYKEIAAAMRTKAYRAVGNAMNKNPYGLLICGYGKNMVPCHRVVDSTGHIHGFAHGLKKKSDLLRKEGIKIRKNKILEFEKVRYRF